MQICSHDVDLAVGMDFPGSEDYVSDDRDQCGRKRPLLPSKIHGTCRVALPFASSPLCAATTIDKAPEQTPGAESTFDTKCTANKLGILANCQKKFLSHSDLVCSLSTPTVIAFPAPCAGPLTPSIARCHHENGLFVRPKAHLLRPSSGKRSL